MGIRQVTLLKNKGGIMSKLLYAAPEIATGSNRRGIFLRGLLILLIGILIALHPFMSGLFMSVMFGCGLLFGGGWITAGAFLQGKINWGWLIYGIAVTLGGLVLLCNPTAGLLAFAWVNATLILSGGIIGITHCVSEEHSSGHTVLCFISWLCTILLGTLLFLFPLLGLTELFWILGILLSGEGAALMIIAFRIPANRLPDESENGYQKVPCPDTKPEP